MTIEFKTGNILDAKETLILQSVNYRKIMGAGLAKQIKNKYPDIFKQYCDFIDENSWEDIKKDGLFDLFKINEEQGIVNIFGQKNFGRDKCYTDYQSLKNGLLKVSGISFLFTKGLSVAIPYKLASGLSGGSWKIVYEIIQDIFENSEVKVVIYRLEGELNNDIT